MPDESAVVDERWMPQASPAARAAAQALRERAMAGQLPYVDLLEFARALESVGLRVHLPPPPTDLAASGWFHVTRKRCKKTHCRACREDPAARPHGPYVSWRWRERVDGRVVRREKHLGSLAKLKKLADRGQPIPFPVPEKASGFTLRFLHDD